MPTPKRLLNTGMQNKGSLSNTDGENAHVKIKLTTYM